MSQPSPNVNVTLDQPGTSVWHDIVTVVAAGTPVQGPKSPTLRSLDIQNQHATALVFWGAEDVTNASGTKRGQRLSPGAIKEGVGINQTRNLWFDADTSGTVISLLGIVGNG